MNRPWRPRGRVQVYIYSFFNLGARWGWVVDATSRQLYPRERDPVSFIQEAGWTPGQVWTGGENVATNGTRSSDRTVRSKPPYRLSYKEKYGLRNLPLSRIEDWSRKHYTLPVTRTTLTVKDNVFLSITLIMLTQPVASPRRHGSRK